MRINFCDGYIMFQKIGIHAPGLKEIFDSRDIGFEWIFIIWNFKIQMKMLVLE